MALPMIPQRKLFCFALISRLVITVLQIVLNNLIPDHEADAFHQAPMKNPGLADRAVEILLGGFRNWDAAYFLHIAEHGYTQHQMFAFFPLLPMATRLLGEMLLFPLQSVMQLRSALLIAGWLINMLIFALTSVVLYSLTKRVCRSEILAYLAAVLFCINPASVFMTAVYTEPLFSLFSLMGMLHLEQKSYFRSAILFSLSAATRSNGTIAVGFMLYHVARSVTSQALRLHQVWNLPNLKIFCRHFVISITQALYTCVIIVTPFVVFQVYAFLSSCKYKDLSFSAFLGEGQWYFASGGWGSAPSEPSLVSQTMRNSRLVPSWCNKTFMIPYSEIQAEEWGVAFMTYYQVKQIPNFVLACPMVVLSLCGLWEYCCANWAHVKHLGLLQRPMRVDVKKTDATDSQSGGFFQPDAFVYWAHLSVLLVFGVLFMHVQVVTRFLTSSSPAVYWISAHIFNASLPLEEDSSPHEDMVSALTPMDIVWRKRMRWEGRLLRGYFLGYCVLGVAMHCNFLPWT